MAKASPRPLDYASGGVGAAHHMAMELLHAAVIKLNHIPYKGGAPALQDVLAGHVPVTWAGLPNAMQHVAADLETKAGVDDQRGNRERAAMAQ